RTHAEEDGHYNQQVLLVPPDESRRHQGEGLLPLPCQGRQDRAAVCGGQLQLAASARFGIPYYNGLPGASLYGSPGAFIMPDANSDLDPLPVIPADDLGQFTAEPLLPQPVIPE